MPQVTREGVRINYEVEGDGPAVVLYTGAGPDIRTWHLAGYREGLHGFRRILIDPRGQGKSDRPPGLATHRVEECRDDVVAVTDEVGEKRVAFLGFSDGAKVGAAFAARYPERVVGFIDFDGLEADDLSTPQSKADRIRFGEATRQSGLEAQTRDFAKSDGYAAPEWLFQNLSEADPEMIALAMEAWTTWDGPASVLPDLRVPILSLRSGKSGPPEYFERLQGLIPRARLRVIPGVGHLEIFVRSDLVLSDMREFLDEVFRGSG
ncbi:MAG: alpha/beta hydrolase [Thermoplasmata archaeon]